jgi:hypothetical protein
MKTESSLELARYPAICEFVLSVRKLRLAIRNTLIILDNLKILYACELFSTSLTDMMYVRKSYIKILTTLLLKKRSRALWNGTIIVQI